ncbi:ABC transporter permease subunit [Dermatobacter hominis]|uniref:ABC transporter permease subunit n=1 Tax=Dermatobacter hominis TaxID=2884263 RepID=UPI001D0FF9AB|nr:ATP-binding cassette domain-containing protein [Dermatobacter hominis]UDY34906.1 ATP-binding cassette domain-containing protein [Dermatobacter hominis]
MTAAILTRQLLLNGLVDGLVFGLLAMALVLVYRSSRVINFAVSNIGLVGASLLALLVVQWDVPFWIALPVSLGAGTLFSVVVELTVIRRLFNAPRVIVVVATVGVAALSQAVAAALPDVDDTSARFPAALTSVWEDVAGLRITGAQLTIIVVVPLVALGLGWFLERTAIGKAVRAAAVNPDLARLSGVNPKTVSTVVWAIAGLLGTVSIVLIAGQGSGAASIAALGPTTLSRALVAAVIARMTSFRIALLAGIAIGLGQAILGFNYPSEVGLADVMLLVVVLIAVALQARGTRAGTASLSFAPRARPVPPELRTLWWARNLDRIGALTLLAAAVVVCLVVDQPSRLVLYAVIASFAIVASSLTVLTGWAGQLSLGQMAFAGIGALVAAAFTRGLSLHVGVGSFEAFAIELYGVPFALSIVIAAGVTSVLAVLLGWGAIRVRGLLLAPVTFVFALAAQQYLFRQDVLTGGSGGTVSFPRGTLLGLDLRDQRTYLLVVVAILAVVLGGLGVLRRSGFGRSVVAARDNPVAAAGYTVSPPSVRLRAFALSGALAGLGGALLAGAAQSINIRDETWLVATSLLLVAMVVVGGLGSIIGPVLGALWIVGLPTFFPDNDLVPLLTSSLGLLIVLLYLPGGLMQVVWWGRDAILDRAARGREPVAAAARRDVAVPRRAERSERDPARPVLEVHGARVRFGGVLAVDGVDLAVHPGEVLGLIGTNGAGKSTLMDVVCGVVSADGTVTVLGQDVSRSSAWQRARLGLGRTHQAAVLFPELTVRQCVEVALESRGRTGVTSTALLLPHARRRERARRAEATDVIDLLGLGRYAEVQVGNLSTGTRRIVELAGLVALDARVMCLDEPTAGVAQRETEAFGPLILELRRELDASVLVIEHDMPLITGISDRIVCMEAGRVIAEGTPHAVRNDPLVVASYLGTDARSIERSGPVRSDAPIGLTT